MKRATRFVLCVWLGACVTVAAHAAAQADRAIAAVKQLIASGEIASGTVLRLRVKQGNMVSFLGRDYELQKDWERLTGVVIDASVMPQLDSLEFIRGATDIDLTIARNHEYADLLHAGLIEDLGPLLARLGFTLGTDPDSGYLLPRHQAYLGERIVAIPADMDVALLFLRRDLLEDPQHRAQYRARTGRELRVPQTWAELQQQMMYFHRPKDGFYGCAEPREKLTGWMYWMPRYLSGAAPNQHLFDDEMRPLLNSPAGIAATEQYVATVQCAPPQVLEPGKDYSYTLPFFIRGNAYATTLTMATAKISNREDSAVRGKLLAVPLPGQVVGGRFVQRTHFIYGNNLIVPAASRHKALALLFALWLTDPDNALRSVVANGLADPYRHNALRDQRVAAMYTPQVLQVLQAQLPHVAPAGTGLPGDAEYIAALNQNLWLAAAGKLSAREAMARTAREWDAITERRGRAQQIAHWRAFKQLYPTVTEAAP